MSNRAVCDMGARLSPSRGVALPERFPYNFAPLVPAAEVGVGAWLRAGA